MRTHPLPQLGIVLLHYAETRRISKDYRKFIPVFSIRWQVLSIPLLNPINGKASINKPEHFSRRNQYYIIFIYNFGFVFRYHGYGSILGGLLYQKLNIISEAKFYWFLRNKTVQAHYSSISPWLKPRTSCKVPKNRWKNI